MKKCLSAEGSGFCCLSIVEHFYTSTQALLSNQWSSSLRCGLSGHDAGCGRFCHPCLNTHFDPIKRHQAVENIADRLPVR